MIPPIDEVGCSFRFSSRKKWDNLSIINQLKPLVDEYPILEGISDDSTHPIGKLEEISNFSQIQLSNEEGNNRIMVADRLIVIQQQGPYVSWVDTKGDIVRVFNVIKKQLKTKNFSSVGLRYINRIVIKDKPIRIRDYFNIGPDFRGPLEDRKFIDFSVKVTLAYDKNDYCKIRILRVLPDKIDESYPVLLDFYYNSFNPVTNDQVEGWLETAHANIEDLFHKSITDKTRALFEKVSDD